MEPVNDTLAIIPARGGSKGIPRKNVLPLAGLPLVAHTIRAAQAAARVGRIIVSTDDAEIGAVAQQYGAEVVWRPAEISGDAASSEAALLHVLDQLEAREGRLPEITVFLQCTSPLTAPEDIDGTLAALQDAGADSAVAVTPFHYFLWREVDGLAQGINHDKMVRPLRQAREPQYLETGAVYVMRTAGFRAARHRFFGQTVLYVTPGERRLEIDEPVDFEIAAARLAALAAEGARRGARAVLPRPVAGLVLDFDGVFTDNRVLVDQDGREAVWCSRSDGWGLARLRETGLPIVILSTERNPVVTARARKLGLAVIQDAADKAAALRAWLAENSLDPAGVVYLGNDVNDLPAAALVGCVAAVADAHPDFRHAAHLILQAAGGHGAIRELCEVILGAQLPTANEVHP
jgi:N-acylneuraminate cytidylyltransferase